MTNTKSETFLATLISRIDELSELTNKKPDGIVRRISNDPYLYDRLKRGGGQSSFHTVITLNEIIWRELRKARRRAGK